MPSITQSVTLTPQSRHSHSLTASPSTSSFTLSALANPSTSSSSPSETLNRRRSSHSPSTKPAGQGFKAFFYSLPHVNVSRLSQHKTPKMALRIAFSTLLFLLSLCFASIVRSIQR